MNKLLTILFLIVSVSVFGQQKMPKDFEFNYKYGFSRKDQTIFDSKSDTLIVTGVDTIMKFKLNLTSEEKQSIYQEMQKINFLDYPESYFYQHPDSVEALVGTPFQKYFLTITVSNNSKMVQWNNGVECKVKDEKHAALMQLDRFIQKIIWSRNPLKDYHPAKMLTDPD
jgi:hypothetical protein